MVDDDSREDEIDRLTARLPGEDPRDPYEDVVISDLPEWWRSAISDFEANDLRPYRPPVFGDGTRKRAIVSELEEEHDVKITFLNTNVGDDYWEVRVDSETVAYVGHRRDPDGYSVFEVSANAFERIIRTAVSQR